MVVSVPKITELNFVEVADKLFQQLKTTKTDSHEHMLPLLFNLNGKPLTLANHFQMRPLFATVLPPDITFKTGRQVSKSMSNAIQSILFAFINPFHNILHITPLSSQVEKFSSDYIAPLIAYSPFRSSFVDRRDKKAIAQRSLRNGSNLIFTFAFHDCTRTRGISANLLKYDEYQSMDPTFEPIINQTLAAGKMKSYDINPDKYSEAGIMRFGTPLTFENGLEQAWSLSSQAEWCIVCNKCKHDNVASRDQDLDKMLGPRTRKEKVTPETPGLVCAKCGAYLYTREGRWVHLFPERQYTQPGYHIPQVVMTFHCEDQKAWDDIQDKRFNQNKTSVAQFYNETLGESYDHGQKLISVTDLKNAAVLPPKSELKTQLQNIRNGRYIDWGLGIDWGGGGQDGISKTAIAVAGLRGDGIVEVFTGYRSNTPHDYNLEASRVIDICNTFQAKFAAMDFNGTANHMRRSKLKEHGYPEKLIRPIAYTNVKELARVVGASSDLPAHIQVNKARSFIFLAQMIRAIRVRFFAYDFRSAEDKGLLNDFTALAEEKHERGAVGDIHLVLHVKTAGPDDFAHAVNYAVTALFIRNGGFPDAGSIMTIGDLTPEQQKTIEPALKDRDFSWFLE